MTYVIITLSRQITQVWIIIERGIEYPPIGNNLIQLFIFNLIYFILYLSFFFLPRPF